MSVRPLNMLKNIVYVGGGNWQRAHSLSVSLFLIFSFATNGKKEKLRTFTQRIAKSTGCAGCVVVVLLLFATYSISCPAAILHINDALHKAKLPNYQPVNQSTSHVACSCFSSQPFSRGWWLLVQIVHLITMHGILKELIYGIYM